MEELIEGVNAKVCSCCKVLKPFSEFNKDSRDTKYGLYYICKACLKISRMANKEKIAEKDAKYRELNIDKIKAHKAKYYQDNKAAFREKSKKYRAANAERIAKSKKEYYDNNRETLSLAAKKYYENNIEKVREYKRQYQIDNREVLAEKTRANYLENIEARREYALQWAKDNKDIVNFHSSKRRAAKLDRTPFWLTAADFSDIADFYYLAKALTEASGVKYVVDHIIPLQGENVSGLHVPSNLQILTESENASKQNKYTIE